VLQDLMTAVALLLIIEGLLPVLAPRFWQEALQQLARVPARTVRTGGIVAMLAGALLLNFLH
jgi:uncharacterized protein YjeT (DUF2065 family)